MYPDVKAKGSRAGLSQLLEDSCHTQTQFIDCVCVCVCVRERGGWGGRRMICRFLVYNGVDSSSSH
jgi:hypothetical protein